MGGRSKGCGAPQQHERSAGHDQTCEPMTVQRAAVAKGMQPLCVAAPAATWAGARERAHTPSARQRGGGWSAPACACTATECLERCASPREHRADRAGAEEHRCRAPSLLAAWRTPFVLRSAARHVSCRCAAVGCAPRVHGIDSNPVCEDALRSRTGDVLTRQRHAACVCDDRADAPQDSSPRKQQGQVEQLHSVVEAGPHAEEAQ